MKYLPLIFVFITQLGHSQDLALVKSTAQDPAKNIQYHYQWESTDGHVETVDLFLLKNHTFEYSIASNVYNVYSTGAWYISKGVLTLNSDFQKGTLPIKISYRQRDSTDNATKRVAFVKDLNNKPISCAFVYINNDSTKCIFGDLFCNGNYAQIDSVKVALENDGPTSQWMAITPHEGIIQINIATKLNLENYVIIKDKRYRIQENKLHELSEKSTF